MITTRNLFTINTSRFKPLKENINSYSCGLLEIDLPNTQDEELKEKIIAKSNSYFIKVIKEYRVNAVELSQYCSLIKK
jgi:hypothetical protein